MRSGIRKELLKLFKSELGRRLPNFLWVEKRPEGTDPKWIWKFAPGLTFFIILQPLRRHDEFVLEVGWTDSDTISYEENYQKSVDIHAPRWGTRLGRLWSRDTAAPVWAVTPRMSDEEERERVRRINSGENIPYNPPDPPLEEALPRVGPLVTDAIDKLEQHAIPLFQRVIEAR